MRKELIQIIEKNYHLSISDFSALKKAWILTTDQGSFFCKPFVFNDSRRLSFIDGAMRHLIKRGYNHILPFKQTIKGNAHFSCADQVYSLTPFITARQCNYDDIQELCQATKLLAGLHLASSSYQPSAKLNPQYFWGLWPRRIKEKIQHLYTFRTQLEKKKNRDEFDNLFIKFFPYYFQQARDTLEKLQASDYSMLMYNEQIYHTFCHHDYEYHNILITPQADYYVIDFDYLLCDTHLHDLTSLLIRVGKRSFWNEQKRDLVLSTYHQIYPLRQNEIPVIKAMLLFPQAYWQVAFARYFEEQPWPLKRFVNEILRKSKHENLRLKYIQQLRYPKD